MNDHMYHGLKKPDILTCYQQKIPMTLGWLLFAAGIGMMAACTMKSAVPLNASRSRRADSVVRGELQVELVGLRGRQGVVRLALFGMEHGFPSEYEKALRTLVLPAKAKLTASLVGLEFGSYALSVIHDENDNQVLDTNWLGMPIEGYGTSNDAVARIGPPAFHDAVFDFSSLKQRIVIRINYP